LTGAASLDLAIKVENNLNINASEGVVRLILSYTRTQIEPPLKRGQRVCRRQTSCMYPRTLTGKRSAGWSQCWASLFHRNNYQTYQHEHRFKKWRKM